MKRVLTITVVIMLMVCNAFGLTDEEKREVRSDVERIYQQEGGKRSREVILEEYLAKTILQAVNTLAIEKLTKKQNEEARTIVEATLSVYTLPDSAHKRIVVPEMAISYHILGDIAREANKLDEGINWYEKAIEVNPKLATAHYNLGFLYSAKGGLTKKKSYSELGVKHFNRAFELDKGLIKIAEEFMKQKDSNK